MPYRKIDKGIKDRALLLYDLHGWYPEDLADVFGFSERSFRRWHRNFWLYNSVIPPAGPVRGRPRILNTFMTRDLHQLVEAAPDLYLDEIQEWFTIAHNVGISVSGIQNNLYDAGLTLKVMTKAAAERDEGRRQEYMAYARDNWVADQLVFVDETSKDDRTIYRHYGRSLSGRNAVVETPFCRGDRYSIVAALTTDGYLSQRVVEQSVNADEFNSYILEDVVSVCILVAQTRN